MNNFQVDSICTAFNLGVPIGEPIRVYGGLLHSMYRLDTTTGSYAVKQLTTGIDLTLQVRHNYELSEQIARAFKAIGIDAIGALDYHGQYLFDCDHNSFLVYPWVNAATLTPNDISATHAIKIARLLARMHNADLQIKDLPISETNICPDKDILLLIAQASALDLSFVNDLQKHQERILEINRQVQSESPLLQTMQRVSHADLDQKNVLWDSNENPILIDWESARKINPVQELVTVALDWSGITTNTFDINIFAQMISAYKFAGGVVQHDMVQAALYGTQLNWINWMVFNIKRSINSASMDLEELKSSNDQVNQAINIILRIDSIKPKLLITI